MGVCGVSHSACTWSWHDGDSCNLGMSSGCDSFWVCNNDSLILQVLQPLMPLKSRLTNSLAYKLQARQATVLIHVLL
jgi:hypothetical protein